MKQIVTYFFLAVLISGCQPPMTHSDGTPPPSSNTIPTDSSNSQQALVIGNSQYKYTPLNHTINDAKDMTDTLTQLGFTVTIKTDLNRQTMIDAVREFGKRLSDNQTQKSVGLFYFSGHGIQVNSQNFLLPINNGNIKEEKDLEPNAVHVKTILDEMEKTNNGINIIILDACYKNPYPNSKKNKSHCLAQMSPPRGALIAFSVSENQLSCDESHGDCGLYTEHLLKELSHAQHERIEDVFMRIRNSVHNATGGKQEPWYQASLRWPPFCFGGCQ
jgi:uncharacterized caspase-like protein